MGSWELWSSLLTTIADDNLTILRYKPLTRKCFTHVCHVHLIPEGYGDRWLNETTYNEFTVLHLPLDYTCPRTHGSSPAPGLMVLHLPLDSWSFTCPWNHSSSPAPGLTDSHMSHTLIYIRDIIIVYLSTCCCALVTSITHLPVLESGIPPLWFLLRFLFFFFSSPASRIKGQRVSHLYRL